MDRIVALEPNALARTPRRPLAGRLRRNAGPMLVVFGLALTVLSLGVAAFALAMLVANAV